MEYEDILRRWDIIPIRLLGKSDLGCVYLTYTLDKQIIAVKMFKQGTYDRKQLEAADITKTDLNSIFLLRYLQYNDESIYPILCMEFANMKTLDIVAKQPHIPLPTSTLRALMRQILEGISVFHAAGMIHRDIKCENILLHSPPDSGRVYVKISDFGQSRKIDMISELTQIAGTPLYKAPELFQIPVRQTQKIDIYSIGVTFYLLIAHQYPVVQPNLDEYQKSIKQMKCIERPSEIKDDVLWDLLSKLLEFDPDKRITADQALRHPYFTSPQSQSDVSKEQQDLASQAFIAELQFMKNVPEYEKEPTFIVPESVIKNFLLSYIEEQQKHQQIEKGNVQQDLDGQQIKQQQEEVINQKISHQDDNENNEINQQSQQQTQPQQLQDQEEQQQQQEEEEEQKQQVYDSVYDNPYEDSPSVSQFEPQSFNQSSQKQQISQKYYIKNTSDQVEVKQEQNSKEKQDGLQPQEQIYSSSSEQQPSPIIQISLPNSSSQSQTELQSDQQLQSSSSSQTLYDPYSYYINSQKSNQASLSYIETEEQLQYERDLLQVRLSLEEIKGKLNQFDNLSQLQIDIILVNLIRNVEKTPNNCNKAKQLGIIDLILNILSTIPPKRVNFLFVKVMALFINLDSVLKNNNQLQQQFIKLMNKFLDPEVQQILINQLLFVYEIVTTFGNSSELELPHPFRAQMQNEGQLNKLIEIFQYNQYQDKYINYYAACIVGHLFKATQLPSEFGPEIVNMIKDYSKLPNLFYSHVKHQIFSDLSENINNHQILLENNTLKLVNDFLLINDNLPDYNNSAIILLCNLFCIGSDETRKLIIKEISLNKIQALKSRSHKKTQTVAGELLQFIDYYNKGEWNKIKDIPKSKIHQQMQIIDKEIMNNKLMEALSKISIQPDQQKDKRSGSNQLQQEKEKEKEKVQQKNIQQEKEKDKIQMNETENQKKDDMKIKKDIDQQKELSTSKDIVNENEIEKQKLKQQQQEKELLKEQELKQKKEKETKLRNDSIDNAIEQLQQTIREIRNKIQGNAKGKINKKELFQENWIIAQQLFNQIDQEIKKDIGEEKELEQEQEQEIQTKQGKESINKCEQESESNISQGEDQDEDEQFALALKLSQELQENNGDGQQ